MVHFNLPQKFITLTINIFTNQTANIIDNKNLFRSFKMKRRVRQKDFLSPILFNLTIEPLLATFSTLPFKPNSILDNIQAFADDMTILIIELDHFKQIETTISSYQDASNAKTNLNKSILVSFNHQAKTCLQNLKSDFNYKTLKELEKLTILGYHFMGNLEIYPNTSSNLLESLEKRLNNLKTRSMSLKGRSLLAGSLLASKLWYMSYVFPPLMKHIDTVQRLLNNWVRNDSKSLLSASIIQLPKSQGGWNLVNVKSAIKARSAITTKKMFTSREKWTSNRLASIYVYQIPRSKIQKQYKKKDWPSRFRPAIKTWFEASRPLTPDQTTATTTTFFKKNLYLKCHWPTTDCEIWRNLNQLNLPPQSHVNAWRWHREALPLKDRVW